MKELSLLIKPVSGLCNMRCIYCFYADVADRRQIRSYGRMNRDTVKGILHSLCGDLSQGDVLGIAFQGGEPTLAGIDFYRDFFAAADEWLPDIAVRWSFQTNGLLLNTEWCRLFRERKVLVGLSVDGPPGTHNAQRPDLAGKGSYQRVHAAMELLRRSGVEYNILTVLTTETARHPAAVWNWMVREKIRYVQFIPCLDPLDGKPASSCALTPSRFRDFYRRLFPLWKQGMEQGQVISIKLFDDLVNLYAFGHATACGITGKCSVQYVVEANGDVFPCDFYALDPYRMGSLLNAGPSSLADAAAPFLAVGEGHPRELPCRGCRYEKSCGGGCRRMRDRIYLENGVCCYAGLLDDILPQLLRFAQSWVSGQ